MTEDVQLHLEEADACLAQAELLLASSYAGGAVSRSYYVMFHAATAALLHRGIKRRSHQGIIAAFGQTFAKPGITDTRFHRDGRGIPGGVIDKKAREEVRQLLEALVAWTQRLREPRCAPCSAY